MATRKTHGLRRLAGATAIAAAGYYFYTSKDAKKHRKIAAAWANKFKGDVMRQAKKLKNVDQKTLQTIVNNVASTYHGAKNMDRKEVERAARELKNNWQHVMKEAGKSVSSAKKSVNKVVKKAVKRAHA